MTPISKALRAAALLATLGAAQGHTHAETAVATLPASAMFEQFAGQLTDDPTPQTSRSFTFSSGGIDWTLTFTAPQGSDFTDATFADYGEAPQLNGGPSFFARKGNISEANHIGAFTLSTDHFANKAIRSVSVAAALLYSTLETKVPLSVSIGSATTLTAEPPVVVSARKFIQPILFTPESPTPGRLTISSELAEGGQFAFLELTVDYNDSPATAEPAHSPAVGIGHVVELTCPDPKAEIFFSLNSAPWQAYDPLNGIVLATEGTHSLSYYAISPAHSPSATQTATFTVVSQSGIDHAIVLAAPVEISGFVASQGNGYTLIGKRPTANPDECIALDNSAHPDLRTAAIGTAVSATGRPTDRFTLPALGTITALSLDGSAIEASRNDIAAPAPAAAASTAYDLLGRPATSRSRLVITPNRQSTSTHATFHK